jgi:hypothetical protein
MSRIKINKYTRAMTCENFFLVSGADLGGAYGQGLELAHGQLLFQRQVCSSVSTPGMCVVVCSNLCCTVCSNVCSNVC